MAAPGDSELSIPTTQAELNSTPNSGPRDWGIPPAEDWPEAWPPDLKFKGWCRFIGAGGMLSQLKLCSGTVFINYLDMAGSKTEVLLVDAEIGNSHWDEVLDHEGGGELANDGSKLYFATRHGGTKVSAYSTESGELLWESTKGIGQCQAGPDLWVVSEEASGQLAEPVIATFSWLSGSQGKPKATLHVDGLQGIGKGDAGRHGPLVYKAKGQFIALYPDGSTRKFPSAKAGWRADIAQFPGGFVAAEGTFDEYEPDMSGIRVVNGVVEDTGTSQTGAPKPWPSVATILSCYSLPDGTQRWQVPLGDNYEHRVYGGADRIECMGDYVLVEVAQAAIGTQLINLTNGAVVWQGGSDSAPGRPIITVSGNRLFEINSGTKRQSCRLQVTSLRDGSQSSVGLHNCPPIASIQVADSHLLLEAAPGGWNNAFAENCYIYCLDLNREGLPIKGQMVAQAYPQDYPELRQSFFASSNPIEDQELMSSIVGSGVNCMVRLLEACPPENATHLDALAAATQYLYEKQSEGRYGVSPINSFVETIRNHAGPCYAPGILRWMDDPRLQDLQPVLPALLAACGGSQAESRLASGTPNTGIRHASRRGQAGGKAPATKRGRAILGTDDDGDGLANEREQLLLTDPTNPDSDLDGVPDAEDGAPLSNPAWMGPAERGIARAMDYFFDQDNLDGSLSNWKSPSSALQARYFVFFGSAPVDYVREPETYTVAVPNTRYDINQPLPGSSSPGASHTASSGVARVTWWEGERPLEERYADYLKRTGRTGFASNTADMEAWASWYPLDRTGGTALPSPHMPLGAEAVVLLDFEGVGYAVEMSRIKGEWFPTKVLMTWIS